MHWNAFEWSAHFVHEIDPSATRKIRRFRRPPPLPPPPPHRLLPSRLVSAVFFLFFSLFFFCQPIVSHKTLLYRQLLFSFLLFSFFFSSKVSFRLESNRCTNVSAFPPTMAPNSRGGPISVALQNPRTSRQNPVKPSKTQWNLVKLTKTR